MDGLLRPSFLLQLTCVGVGDVCNKGKVRAAKLSPAVSVGHVGSVIHMQVLVSKEIHPIFRKYYR